MKTERQKMIDKVQKLLRLSESSNEHEASLAIEKAHAILAQYNLTLADVQEAGASVEYKYFVWSAVADQYTPVLWNAMAKLYFCQYVRSGKGDVYKHAVVGEEHNVRVASMMMSYVLDVMERLVSDLPAYKEKDWLVVNSWGAGLVQRLQARIYERIRQTAAGDGSGLPALASAYQKSADEITNWLDKRAGKPLLRQSLSLRYHDQEAFEAGIEAGNSIGLDTQVTSAGLVKQIEAGDGR